MLGQFADFRLVFWFEFPMLWIYVCDICGGCPARTWKSSTLLGSDRVHELGLCGQCDRRLWRDAARDARKSVDVTLIQCRDVYIRSGDETCSAYDAEVSAAIRRKG